MYFEWTQHSRARAEERFGITDVHLVTSLMHAAWDNGESWWEYDPRTRKFDYASATNKSRGITENWVIPFSWQGDVVFAVTRRCDTDTNRYWIVSVLTHEQYLNNRKGKWKRSREAAQRPSAEALRNYPFENLGETHDDET